MVVLGQCWSRIPLQTKFLLHCAEYFVSMLLLVEVEQPVWPVYGDWSMNTGCARCKRGLPRQAELFAVIVRHGLVPLITSHFAKYLRISNTFITESQFVNAELDVSSERYEPDVLPSAYCAGYIILPAQL